MAGARFFLFISTLLCHLEQMVPAEKTEVGVFFYVNGLYIHGHSLMLIKQVFRKHTPTYVSNKFGSLSSIHLGLLH